MLQDIYSFSKAGIKKIEKVFNEVMNADTKWRGRTIFFLITMFVVAFIILNSIKYTPTFLIEKGMFLACSLFAVFVGYVAWKKSGKFWICLSITGIVLMTIVVVLVFLKKGDPEIEGSGPEINPSTTLTSQTIYPIESTLPNTAIVTASTSDNQYPLEITPSPKPEIIPSSSASTPSLFSAPELETGNSVSSDGQATFATITPPQQIIINTPLPTPDPNIFLLDCIPSNWKIINLVDLGSCVQPSGYGVTSIDKGLKIYESPAELKKFQIFLDQPVSSYKEIEFSLMLNRMQEPTTSYDPRTLFYFGIGTPDKNANLNGSFLVFEKKVGEASINQSFTIENDAYLYPKMIADGKIMNVDITFSDNTFDVYVDDERLYGNESLFINFTTPVFIIGYRVPTNKAFLDVEINNFNIVYQD